MGTLKNYIPAVGNNTQRVYRATGCHEETVISQFENNSNDPTDQVAKCYRSDLFVHTMSPQLQVLCSKFTALWRVCLLVSLIWKFFDTAESIQLFFPTYKHERMNGEGLGKVGMDSPNWHS